MSSIITFYSYKGGVGRSMALANIAFELARRNKKVLMVDWDLEAPGLERYFSHFEINNKADGLLPLLLAFNRNEEADYNDYLWTIATTFEHPIYLLHSGRERNPAQYSADLEGFDWDHFFTTNGGLHLENLRNQWLKEFDLVLIDSRTGLSDASGVCTIMLPDVVMPMFTANYQSLFGIRDIMNFIQSARQRLSVDRMALTIMPVPARFGTRVEFKESQEWLDRIADILKDCFSDWLPRWIEPRYVLEQIKIPQVDYFSFGEKLAVVEQGTNDPEGMGFIYAKLADFLASDFTDIKAFVGEKYYDEKKAAYERSKAEALIHTGGTATDGYKYDLFISYPRSVYQWAREVLLPALTEYLNDELGYSVRIFFDASEISAGDTWNDNIKMALESSKTFLFIFSDAEPKSDFLNKEFLFAETLQRTTEANIIIPVLFTKAAGSEVSGLPASVRERPIADLSAYTMEAIKSSTKLSAQFAGEVERLSALIAHSISTINHMATAAGAAKKDIRLEIESLAGAYENIRKLMTSSRNRTRLMQGVVDKMKGLAAEAEPILPQLTDSAVPGERLAAIAVLQEKPNLDYIDWLADHVGDIEKPFVGYQAAVGLYIATRSLGREHKEQFAEVLNKAAANIDKYQYRDPEQISVLNTAKKELELAG